MPRDYVALVGRQVELAAVEECVETAALVLVRGNVGTGKTTLLSEVHRVWTARGITVLSIRYSADHPTWDELGTRLVIDAIRNNFHEIGDSRVAAAMAAVSRASAPETYTSVTGRSALFSDLVKLFRCLRSNGSVAVLIDDVHASPNPEMAVAAAQQAACTVVAASREDGITGEPTSLGAIASRVLDLAPLPVEHVGELLATAASGRLDESVAPMLGEALGSLAGNPGAVLGVFAKLREEGHFTEVRGYLCLSDPAVPVALPAEHHLVRHMATFGETGAQLLALVKAADRFSVDDLLIFAAATGRELGDCGRMVDDLVAAGALDYDEDGILNIPCPALITAVLAESCPQGMATLHRMIAEYLLRPENAHLADPAVVADHITLAGATLSPDPAVVPLLDREAARVHRVNPVLAGWWYRAALRHCPPENPDSDRILSIVLRLLVRLARYQCVGDVVADAVAVGFEDARRYELAVAAALAAVHTGVPVSPEVRSALMAGERGRAPLVFADAWFAGRPFTGDQVESAFGAFRTAGSDGSDGSASGPAFEVADDNADIVTLFKLVLGDEYGEPEIGPIAIYHRLLRDYVAGEWRAVPSSARQLELAGATNTAIHEVARTLCAEVFASLGEYAIATQWLEDGGAHCVFPALRAWVGIRIFYWSGDWDLARERGWSVYEEVGAKVADRPRVGLRSYLVRLASIELERPVKLQGICDDVKRWNASYGGETFRLTDLMMRGLAEHDYAAATEAVDIVRELGDVSELMRALMVVAFFVEDPGPWYHEAYEIARGLGGDWMRMHIKTYMRDSGVATPARRVDRKLLTDTEKRVISLIQQGLTNRQIAGAMRVSEKTVENHLTRLFAKTGCRSRLDLATASLEGRLTVAEQGWAQLTSGKSG